jgi:hypothetical protein
MRGAQLSPIAQHDYDSSPSRAGCGADRFVIETLLIDVPERM